MNSKNLLCIALMAENGQRYHAEVYEDGTARKEDGEVFKLTSYQFENVKVLTRRANREKMLAVAANDVLPFREGDTAPEPYVENILPLTETDFLLPEERDLFLNANHESVTVELQEEEVQPDKPLPPAEVEPLVKEKEEKWSKKDGKEKAKKKAKREKDGGSGTGLSEGKPKTFIPLILTIVLLLCCAGFGIGIGYINGQTDFFSGIFSAKMYQSNSSASMPETTSEPTPTLAPPKTEINLTINAMEGAEVTGSADVGANELGAEIVSGSTVSEGTSFSESD